VQNKIQCPFSSKKEMTEPYRCEKYYFIEEKIFLFSALLLLIISPLFLIFHAIKWGSSFEYISICLLGWVATLLLMVFFYERAINSKFTNNETRKNMPSCGIFRVAYDVLFRQSILLREFDLERKSKYGDIYLSFFGLRPVVIATSSKIAEIISKDYVTYAKSDPRDLNMPFFYNWVGNNNVVLANGDRWQEIRKLIHPVVNNVDAFLPVMNKKALLFCEKIQEQIAFKQDKDGMATIALTRWLKALPLDVAGEALFGYDFNHLNEQSNPGIDATDYILNEIFNPLRLSFSVINRLPIASNRKLKNAIKLLDGLVSDMIAHYVLQKRNHPIFSDKNVLAMLVDNEDAINHEELRNNILALVLASHETTQVSLSGVLYYLAKYPHWQDKLRDESIELFPNIEEMFSSMNDAHDVKNTPYWKLKTFKNLDNFILESLRLYSPLANQNPRTTMESVEIEGYQIPKGATIIMNLHAIHMSEAEWKNPDIFDPDRFNKGNRRNKYSFLPFGNGPRICSGREFSIIEQKLVVCYLLRRFEITLSSEDYTVPLKRYSFTGIPEDHFSLRFQRRI
jgi:cytochrome P450